KCSRCLAAVRRSGCCFARRTCPAASVACPRERSVCAMLNPYNEMVRARLGRPDSSAIVRAALVGLSLAPLTACHQIQAKTPAPTVALNTPRPPPRVTIPVPLPEPEPDPPPPPPVVAPDAPVRGRGAAPPKPTENRPPTPAAAPAPPADPIPSPVLRTTPDT